MRVLPRYPAARTAFLLGTLLTAIFVAVILKVATGYHGIDRIPGDPVHGARLGAYRLVTFGTVDVRRLARRPTVALGED